MNRSVEGGLAQISVEGGALILNSAGRSTSLGTAWVELVNFMSDMIDIYGIFGRSEVVS